jgi:hexosaminidase
MAIPAPSIIPYPASLERREAEFILQDTSSIRAPASLAREAAFLAGHLRRASGFPIEIAEQNRPANGSTVIHLMLDSECSHLGQEGYRLIAEAQTVELRASTRAGIFYGIQT